MATFITSSIDSIYQVVSSSFWLSGNLISLSGMHQGIKRWIVYENVKRRIKIAAVRKLVSGYVWGLLMPLAGYESSDDR